MPREAEPSLNERQFVLQALKEGLRLDGRKFDQYRSLELTFGDQYGVVEVSLGKTKFVFNSILFVLYFTHQFLRPESLSKRRPKSQSPTQTVPLMAPS